MKQQFGSITVEYDEEANLILWKPINDIYMADWYASFNFGIDYFIRLHKEGLKPNWLNDCRGARFVSVELVKDLKHKNQLLFEHTPNAKIGFIMSKSHCFNACILTYVNLTILDPNCNLKVQTFKEVNRAYNWVRKQPLLSA